MKKLLFLFLLLPCIAGAQTTTSCDNYIDDRDFGTSHDYHSKQEITLQVDNAPRESVGIYFEMENYRHSFRIHIRSLRPGNYMGNAQVVAFVFGNDTRIAYPLGLKRTNGEWILEFAGRAPETELLDALRTRTIKAIRLEAGAGVNEYRTISMQERFADRFTQTVACMAGMLR